MSDEGGEEVNYIVNPWFFYLVEVAGDTKEAFGLIALCSLALSACAWFVAIISEPSSTDIITKSVKIGKWSLFIGILSWVLRLLIPSSETLVAMELAGFATVDNVEILIQKIQEAARYIVDSISK